MKKALMRVNKIEIVRPIGAYSRWHRNWLYFLRKESESGKIVIH